MWFVVCLIGRMLSVICVLVCVLIFWCVRLRSRCGLSCGRCL